MQIQFKEWPCVVELASYHSDNNALVLKGAPGSEFEGELIAVCTRNLHGLANGEIAIANYSENEGMLNCLLLNQIIHPPHRFERSGFVTFPICRLKINL